MTVTKLLTNTFGAYQSCIYGHQSIIIIIIVQSIIIIVYSLVYGHQSILIIIIVQSIIIIVQRSINLQQQFVSSCIDNAKRNRCRLCVLMEMIPVRVF